jgi:hypothetical protein
VIKSLTLITPAMHLVAYITTAISSMVPSPGPAASSTQAFASHIGGGPSTQAVCRQLRAAGTSPIVSGWQRRTP